MVIKSFALTISIALALAPVAYSQAAKPDINNVDSILDRLEKRLLEQESQSLTFGTEEAPAPSKAPIKRYQMKKDQIQTELPEAEKLRELATAISEIESQVDQLSSDVQRSKQKVAEDARINNAIRIEAHLVGGSDEASIRSIQVKLDGYEVYAINDAAGLWMPAKALPLYNGPLQPGDHSLELDAMLTLKAKDNLPLHTNQHRTIKQTFKLNVPEGQISKKWKIELQPAKTPDAPSTATLKYSEAT